MPDTPSLVIAKSFSYRGAPETWTNKYHFSGTTPANQAGWLTLLRAVWDVERSFLGNDVTLVGGTGYAAGNEAAVAMFDVNNIGGTTATNKGLANVSSQAIPGDVAVWMRWATDKRNSKNKPIYLRKYFHGVPLNQSDGDAVESAIRAVMITANAKLFDGTLPGGFKVCGPQGAVALAGGVAQFSTTRTLKRNARTPI